MYSPSDVDADREPRQKYSLRAKRGDVLLRIPTVALATGSRIGNDDSVPSAFACAFEILLAKGDCDFGASAHEATARRPLASP